MERYTHIVAVYARIFRGNDVLGDRSLDERWPDRIVGYSNGICEGFLLDFRLVEGDKDNDQCRVYSLQRLFSMMRRRQYVIDTEGLPLTQPGILL